ncbi:MAG: CPBP family intramembrane glutamic endopeptidase [Candidatus Jordarchaeum sp.]|uniref:CPBP family intramembrane glutamic endopeptidase n=1 Tax=Candidatus Jordarchaeum sp. TaxID=2823881 RepID=UPI00404B4479
MEKKNKFCPKCRVKYKADDSEFCMYCGGKLVDENSEYIRKDKMGTQEMEHRTRASWGWIPAVLGYTASFFLLILLQNLLSGIGPILVPSFMIIPFFDQIILVASPELLVFITLGQFGLIVVPFLYIKIKGLSVKELGFDFEDKTEVQKDIFVGAIGGSLMIGISMFISWVTSNTLGQLYSSIDIFLAGQFSLVNNASFMSIYLYQYILLVLSMFLVIAPSEEISTRGFLQQGLENSFGRWAGLFITAIIFSALHIILYPQSAAGIGLPGYVGSIAAILAIPSYLALSLTLGILLQIRKYRIITTITTHAVYMTILVSIYYFLNYWIYFYF